MRILFVSHVPVAHGSAASLATLAVALREQGHRIMVVVPEYGPLSEQLLQRDIEVAQTRCSLWAVPPQTSLRARQWHLREAIGAAREITGVIRQFRPDVVHTNSAVIPSGALAARWTNVPHVWHLREHVEPRFGMQFILAKPATLSIMGHSSAALIAISRSVMMAYRSSATQKKLVLVYNGLDIRPDLARTTISPSSSEPPLLALIGNLLPLKGQEEAIRAVAILVTRGMACRLALIGADPIGDGERLRAIAAELAVSDRVTFTGHLPDPLSEAAQASIVLMCSQCEGFGRVTVEAMLLGKPVVGAAACATVEIVEDGRTGLLYRQGDPHDLAEKIAALLANPAWADELGKAGREAAQTRFPVSRYVNEVLAVYRRVAAAKTEAAPDSA